MCGQAYLESLPGSAYIVGKVAVSAFVSAIPVSTLILVKLLVQSDGFGSLITKPQGYELIWDGRDSGGEQEGSFWRVLPSYGYKRWVMLLAMAMILLPRAHSQVRMTSDKTWRVTDWWIPHRSGMKWSLAHPSVHQSGTSVSTV